MKLQDPLCFPKLLILYVFPISSSSEYLASVPQLDTIKKKTKKNYKLPRPAVIKVFVTGCSECVICAFKGVRSGSYYTENITDLFWGEK